MVMIEKQKHACAHERKIVLGNHIGKHLHLTASLHLKHRVHMEAATSMKGDAPVFSHKIFITNEDLMQELSTLQKSPVFRDPPMSPSCESMHYSETLSRGCEMVLFSRKEVGSLQLNVGSSNNSEIIPLTNDQRKNYANQGSKRGSLEKKIRRKRVKVWAIVSNNGAASLTGLSARGSCSLQSPSCALSSAKRSTSLPSAKGLHLLDISGLSENECRVPRSSAHIYSKALQVSTTQDTKHTELSYTEKSPPCSKPAISFPETADIPDTSCRKQGLDAPSTSLSMKYAPKTLCEIIGQHLVTQALINALSKGKVAPMYIFYGPRGTGKTICARLFAMALNCLSRGSRPCWTCSLCSGQITGKLSPIKEIQAGKAYTVKEITSLIKEISWSSSFLYKVCIVDECQDLSTKVWNSLLKDTKAASKRTVFIFNTLSVEHIPHAVVSRCQKFHFSKIKESDIIDRLQMIALQEGLEADTEAIRLIASVCNGSLYDAELMLEHFSFLGKRVKVPVVQDLVGLISDSTLLELLDSALSENVIHTVQILKAFHESGVEPLHLISQLASLITRILAGGYHVPNKWKLGSRFFQSKEYFKEALLEFHHLEHFSRVQRSKASILHAFQATLGRRVKVKVHLVSRATEHLTKQNSAQQEVENFDAVQLDSAMHGSGRSDIQLKTHRGGIEQNHQETELTDFYEPHIVYDTIPKLINGSQKASYDERLQIVSAENIEVSGLPNAIKCTPHNAYTQVWSQWSHSTLDNGISLGYVLNQAEGSLDGYSLDYRTNTASRRDSTHHMYSNASQSRDLALAALKLQEETLRMEPASKETACWAATTNKACGLVECFQSCSKHSKFFFGLFPCASVSRSHGTS